MKQAPSSILMVRPEHFGFNPETAESNAFQSFEGASSYDKIRKAALTQFDHMVDILRQHGINVLTFHSPKYRKLPDAVFPNNWVTFHENGKVIIYPMLAKNRRLERRLDIIDAVGESFVISEIIDLSPEENSGHILEGSGSIVFDHKNTCAYANESPRTSKYLFEKTCRMLGYRSIFFKATDEQGVDIFHTNVMMNIGDGFAVVCLESIDDHDRGFVAESLKEGGLEIVDISRTQMKKFVGNMIQLQNDREENFLLMSDSAFNELKLTQKDTLLKYVNLIHVDIGTIESVGGGSARCMVAGIHLEPK